MFIYNLKLNKRKLSKLFIIISLLIIISIVLFTIYIIFFKHHSNNNNKPSNEIFEINETNYTNILKGANENIDAYMGVKVRIIGYVYRLIDFNDNEFVVARDMKIGDNGKSLVVGFLCNYKKASIFSDGTWVEIEGKITKGNFNGDIAIIDVESIKEADKPQNIFVNPPDNTYIPTFFTLKDLK